jgi:predicted metal-dependent phosphoesterase TrpH
MRRARAAGLDVLSLTDHDTQAGYGEARGGLPPGLTLVPGMELSCRLEGHSVHLLAYRADPAHPALATQCEAIVASRVERGVAMVARLRELGATLSWERVLEIAGGGVIGRPHIARAMAETHVVGSPEAAFTREWIGTGGRAYIPKYAPDPVTAIGLVSSAGGVTVLAHPAARSRGWTIPDEAIERLAGAGLAGLEVNHPDHGHWRAGSALSSPVAVTTTGA